MKGKARRLLSWVCVLALCMSLLPVTALAAPTESGTQENPVTNTKNQVTVNKWVSQDQDGSYRLNMEAYASNEVTSTTTTKPLDIVLVLDVSGSMDDGFGESGYVYSLVEKKTNWSYNDISSRTYYYEKDGKYYPVVGKADWSWETREYENYRIGYETGSWWDPDFHQLGKASDDPAEDLVETTLYTRHYEQAGTKLDSMKTAVNSFIDSVAESAKKTEADHQISVVQFAYERDAHSNYPTETVANLTSVNTEQGVADLKEAVNGLRANGATRADEGLKEAQTVLNRISADRNSQKVVVLFTDGEPTSGNSFEGRVAATAVNTAKDMKDDNVTIYTVGIFEGADPSDTTQYNANRYMNAVSSNYPSATAQSQWYGDVRPDWDSLQWGDRASGDYYLAAENANGLEEVFKDIADTVTDSTLEVYPDAQAVLTDTLSQYFNFPSSFNATEDVTAKYIPVSGKTEDTYTWDDSKSEDMRVDVTTDGDTIEITGFDYVDHAVTLENDEYSGGKLVVSFPIELDINACRTDRTEDGLYPTNSIDTDTQAGLKYKENAQAEKNTANTLLPESPKVAVDVFQTGDPIHIDVYVDGDLQTSVGDWLRVTPVSDSSGAQASFDPATDNVTYEYTYYNCKDIGFTAKNGYVIQGIDAKLVYGQSGCKGIYDPNTTDAENDDVGTLVADNVKNGTTVAVYLSTLYSAQFHTPDEQQYGDIVSGLVAYEQPLTPDNPSEMGEALRPEEGDSYIENEKEFTYVEVGDGSKDHAAVAEKGQQEGHGYVYSLTAGKTEDNKEIPVRLQFKNGDQVMTSDDFDMSAAQVHQTYDMTIYSGELEQGQIKAKLTVGEEGTEQSISCDIKIGSGELTIRSVVDKIDNTNAIAADENAVTDTETATAVPNGDVDYYVNDSKVEVKNEGDRVQLLVDQVSDNTDFNAAMGNDAVAKVNAALEEGNTLSNAAYDLAYMDLVDTQNGNTVVTMGDNQSLFIYWPVPEDAAADSEFHVVHYTGMDRENTVDADELSVQDADVKTGEGIVDKVTIGDGDQEYVKFTTDSFSPFALVYEKAPDPVAKLEVTKTLTKVNGQPYTGGSVSVNDTLTYTITVKNGEVALNNVTITDTFNGKGDLVFNGYTATENPAGTYTINLGNLEANATVTITATYKVLRADASSNLTNTVSVTGTPTDGGEPTTGGDTETTPVNPYHPPIRPPVDPDKPELNTEDHYAYIVGYEDGSVQPEGDITRAEVATIFFRLLTDESRNEYWSQTNPYSDVSADDWFNNAVSTLTNAGVLDGYEDGTFKPNGNITRAEFATITARFFEATYDGENLFPDIEGHWAQDYINEAANAGIVNGYEDGTFRPQQYITRAEAVTMVNRTIERHPDADHLLDDMITWPDNPETAWYYEQIQEATNSHEYTMNTDDEQNPYEIWTKLLPNRDWSELEKEWSDANDGAGSGEVV